MSTRNHSVEYPSVEPEWDSLVRKVMEGGRISPEEGIALYERADLGMLGGLADAVRKRKNGEFAFFNRNFHIEPTNLCAYRCKFCSYVKPSGDPGAWELSVTEMLDIARTHYKKGATEVHITGGAHPDKGLDYYADLIRRIHEEMPDLHIKAFSAVELEYMFKKSGVSTEKGLNILKSSGLGSIPGGGAEIFDEEIRSFLCPGKSDAASWLNIHESAHLAGIGSNATMLYGHMESYAHRIDHMERLRSLQDRTSGFHCFIPLKFKRQNNSLGIHHHEVSSPEDLRNFALSRIFLDNFDHIKAYWPMLGREMAALSLSFGVDDLDGTIDDSTKIYAMAGAEDQNPAMTTNALTTLIRKAGRCPAERNSLYQTLHIF